MGILSWFRKSAPPDYETLLSRLASEVHDAKVHLSEIRLRERRFSLLINLYGLALWAAWVGLWWVGGLPLGLLRIDSHSGEGRALGAAGVMAGPIFVWGLNRLKHFYFSRQRRYEEAHLRKLLAEQKKQVDAIKKATNYDATRKLIEEYDVSMGGGPAGTPNQRMATPQRGQGAPGGAAPQTPQNQLAGAAVKGTPKAPGHLVGAGGTPMLGPNGGTPMRIPEGMSPEQAALMHMQQVAAVQPILPTPEKKWYDRVVDSILGEDPSHATQSKFALVCGECFRHNGLVGSKYEWERMQWICPRCNHMNPPPISRARPEAINTQRGPATPAAPQSIAPQIPASPATPSHLPRQTASPRPRRQMALGDTGTPRASRLRQEVFSDEQDGQDEDEGMDVDERS